MLFFRLPSEIIPIYVRKSMGRVIANNRLPLSANLDLQLHDKFDHPARLGSMVMPDSRIRPYRECVAGLRQCPGSLLSLETQNATLADSTRYGAGMARRGNFRIATDDRRDS